MQDLLATWELSRGRFVKELEGLTTAQLNYRIHPNALTIGEMAIHVAGVEVSFTHQLRGNTLDEFADRVRRAATDGSVNDKPFPFAESEITPETVSRALSVGESMARPLLEHPKEELRAKEIVSALGPVITGAGALSRFAFHPGYHHGQAYLIKTSPGFPTA